MRARVVVIGGGFAGTHCARTLKKLDPNLSVALVEPELGSLQRRLRDYVIGMPAEAHAYDSAEFVGLETYLMYRAIGLKIESPGIRP